MIRFKTPRMLLYSSYIGASDASYIGASIPKIIAAVDSFDVRPCIPTPFISGYVDIDMAM